MRDDVQFVDTTELTLTQLPRDPTLELQSVRISIDQKEFDLVNVYIPPVGSCPRHYVPELEYLSTLPNAFVLGDFNAHDPVWYQNQVSDPRAAQLSEQLEGMTVLNDPSAPTRSRPGVRPTSPDISFCSASLATDVVWRAYTELQSDHRPIVVQLNLRRPIVRRPFRTYRNYKRADWDAFTTEVEDRLMALDPLDWTCIDASVSKFTSVVTEASKKHIPAGFVRDYNPSFSRSVRRKIRERNTLRDLPQDPATADRIRLLNLEISAEIRERQEARWKATVEEADYRTSPAKLWRLIRSLQRKANDCTESHEAIRKAGVDRIPSIREQSDILMKHYASISRLPHTPLDRQITRRLHRIRLEDLPVQFTPTDTVNAIKGTKKTGSQGPDGISSQHLGHLGPHGIRYLTGIFNWSVHSNSIPNLWKRAKIVPIPKEGKPLTLPSSYRPISLLCVPSKILERLVLDRITQDIPLSDTQHGFRPHHSTTTLLSGIVQRAREGMNAAKPAERTLAVAVDISKAFDSVPRYGLIAKLMNTAIHPNYVKWLGNFLSGRHAFVEFRGMKSRIRHLPHGVPQGSVLSPSLFNLFMHDLPTPASPATCIASYADDLTVISRAPTPHAAAALSQDYMGQLELWLATNRMEVAPGKCSITLITPFNREYAAQPRVTLNGIPIPVEPTLHVLGVTLDRSTTFKPHVQEVSARARSRLNVLRAVAGTTYGNSKESVTALYKQYVRPVMEYACPAWTPGLARIHHDTLQRTQNAALRIATGSTRSTPVQHLHNECRVLPLKQHMDMRGAQFLAKAEGPSHPCHYFHNPTATPRAVRMTPARYLKDCLESIPPCPQDTSIARHVHNIYASRAIEDRGANSILGFPPPQVDPSETQLSRADRVNLGRLRCGHHTGLRSYRHRIGLEAEDLCLRCLGAPDTTSHVVEVCPSLSQEREAMGIVSCLDLWTQPVESADFLRVAGLL